MEGRRFRRAYQGSVRFPRRSRVLDLYLLDTNHCYRLLNGDTTITQRLEELGDTPVVTCAIVQGELVFMAHKSERKADNLHHVREFFEDIRVYPVNGGVSGVYG